MTVVEIYRSLRAGLSTTAVVIGCVLGFAGMCVLGRQAARVDVHKNFVRFTQYTSPESKYYPTVNEMMSIVRTKIKPGQILVVVGGNSVLRGVAQQPDQVWTKRLQEDLGDGYCVVNFAFNSSLITDGASVVAEALRNEFPRQIYIANAWPTQPPTPGGSNVYRWVYWDAYYKGLLVNDAARSQAVAENIRKPYFSEGIAELRISAWLDSWFYFNDFWNDVAYQDFNTVWGRLTPGFLEFLKPRKDYPDPDPDGSLFPFEVRYPASTLEGEMTNVRGCSIYAFNKDAAGVWQVYDPVWLNFTEGIKNIFPPELKKRTLILMSDNSPYYVGKLNDEERHRDEITFKLAVQKWKEGGFDSIEYGRDFAPSDYFDRIHLTRYGAAKLATIVSAKVREMSKNLGYLDPK
jgi:lysophospholipase L1-like esterase